MYLNATATTKIYTLSLHDALPIYSISDCVSDFSASAIDRFSDLQSRWFEHRNVHHEGRERSEEHTSELQSRRDIVCRLLLEKKKLISGVDRCIHLNAMKKTTITRI